ncbi:MAG TPA: TRAP transporter small permease [Alphaproteobacteria bacterium]|nr:TRAP transporter small permease [Alphaproteobacteria bacterium]
MSSIAQKPAAAPAPVALPHAPAAAPAPSAPLRALMAAEEALTRTSFWLAGLALVGAASSAMWQVLMRFIFEQPQDWSEPLSRLLLIWMVFLGLPHAIRMGALVSIDLAVAKSRGRVRFALRTAILLAELVLLGFLAYFGTLMAMRVSGQVLAGLEVSIAWGYAIIPIGALLTVPAAVMHWLDHRSTELETAQ